MPREELRCFEALLRNAPQHDGVTFSRSWNAIIGSRYSDQPVVQTGQSCLHNFKDNEHARALWSAYACSKHRYSVADTRICLAAFPRLRREGWWSRSGSNRRPQACKARALPTERRPQGQTIGRQMIGGAGWWARDELNVRPHAYQACALTT